MTAAPTSRISITVLDQLLACSDQSQRVDLLHVAGLLNPGGVADLLDIAAQTIRDDPGRAQRIAAVCAAVADAAAMPEAAPRAQYLRAQACAANAEFDTALQLIDAAGDAYHALGKDGDALRTHIGRMGVLIDLGRYAEALDTGRSVVQQINSGVLHAPPAPADADMMIALVHQNTGICYEQMGRYADALDAYKAAEHHFATLHMPDRMADISNNRGIVLMQLGRTHEALTAFNAAATTFKAQQSTLLHAQALINIGDAHLLLGDYTQSLAILQQARQLFDALDAQAEEHVLLLDTANAYLALNLYPEAIAAFREAEHHLTDAGVLHHRARALWGLGSALIANGPLAEAEHALDQAAALFMRADNVPLLAGVLLEQAAVQATRADQAAALATAQQALALVPASTWPVEHVYAQLRLADLLLPDTAQAEHHLRHAQHVADRIALPHIHYRLKQRWGHIRRLQHRFDEAQAWLEAAIEEIERLRGTLIHETMRTSFLHDKLAAHTDLIQLFLMQSDPHAVWRAFAAAEQAKSRALVDVLTGDAVPASARGLDRATSSQLETLRAELNALYNALFSTAHDQRSATHLADLQRRAATLEREINQLLMQRAVEASATSSDHRRSSRQRPAALPADVLTVAYHIVDNEILAFVGQAGTLQVVRHLSTLPIVQRLIQRLAMQWDRWRVGAAFVDHHRTALERSAQRVLAELYAALIAPLEALLADAPVVQGDEAIRSVLIVPHGVLHHVPFHALFDGEQYLIDRFELSYAPSLTVHALCQQRSRRAAGSAVVIGIADPLLPAVGAEVQAVADHVPNAVVLTDAQATLAAVRQLAPRADLLHIACHGLFRADNPLFSALKLHDGWLTAVDVAELDLGGALVTLSACESGRSQVIAGDETLGLTRAFVAAGARTLVVSLWLVQDDTTAALMQQWYANMRRGQACAAALRAAQLALKATHRHPYYWAPFVLVGQR